MTTTATPEHPFYVIGQGYIQARNLRAGDIVVTVNGDRVVVEAIQHEILENPITVYNFEVEGNHNYYANDVLVHNTCAAKAAGGDTHGNIKGLDGDIEVLGAPKGNNQVGSYDITYVDGKHYLGKGGIDSAHISAKQHGVKGTLDDVTSIQFRHAANDTAAFIDEAQRMINYDYGTATNLYNKIRSPGYKYGGFN